MFSLFGDSALGQFGNRVLDNRLSGNNGLGGAVSGSLADYAQSNYGQPTTGNTQTGGTQTGNTIPAVANMPQQGGTDQSPPYKENIASDKIDIPAAPEHHESILGAIVKMALMAAI
jgi:hypothetical protein